jgi:hypothetical protein
MGGSASPRLFGFEEVSASRMSTLGSIRRVDGVLIGQTHIVRLPQFRSPVAKAAAPVLAGLGFFAVLGLLLWGIAAVMSGEQVQTTTLTPDRLKVGDVRTWAESIDEDGPVLFPGLGTTTGTRTIVLDHEGDDPERGWSLHYAYPGDRGESCAIEQIPGTDTFSDCEGRTLSVSDLAVPTGGEFPIIEDRRTLYIDLGERPLDSIPAQPDATAADSVPS